MKKSLFLTLFLVAAFVGANAQDLADKMKYNRSSLSTWMVYNPADTFVNELRTAFSDIPCPDKYDDHNIDMESRFLSAEDLKLKTVWGAVLSTKAQEENRDSLLAYLNRNNVAKTLQDLNIDERDVAGKIYFLNFFRCIDDDDNLITDTGQVLSVIYYTIVIPQRDKVTFVEKRWNTLTNNLDGYDKETVFYKNISGIQEQADWIRFKFVGGTERTIASQWRANVLHYQSESPQDVYSYSITRTGDQQEFLQAIEKLVAAYQK